MYFKDMSLYSYQRDERSFNIGWLDDKHQYSRGEVDINFLTSLWEYMKYPINQTRGYHSCQLCEKSKILYASYNGIEVPLGTSEIRVFSPDSKTIFSAPNLIIHYIIDHHYRPPEIFISSVINGIKPDTSKYREMVQSYSVQFKAQDKIIEQNMFSTKDSNACPMCRCMITQLAYRVISSQSNDICVSAQRNKTIQCARICQYCGYLFVSKK